MNNKDFKPKKLLVLREQPRIKAYVHPTRILILRMLARKKMTVSNIARKLSVHPANITHHIRLLEKAGLIKLVEKKDISKNIEKYYRAIAGHFVVSFDKTKNYSKKALALSILRNDLSTAIKTAGQNNKDEIITVIKIARILPQDIKKLQEKIIALIREFSRYDSSKGKAYTMNISVYPNETGYISREEIIIDE
jgi:DNA-binding transcriptional ArsR family regulator